eukprot:4488989-Pyramimonas_sp.AAC.1
MGRVSRRHGCHMRQSRWRSPQQARRHHAMFKCHLRTSTYVVLPNPTCSDWRAQLTAIFECATQCARTEQPGTFSNELYGEMLQGAVTGDKLSPELVGVLVGRYLKFADVRYHTYSAVARIADQMAKKPAKKGGKLAEGAAAMDAPEDDVVRNLYDIMANTPLKFGDIEVNSGTRRVNLGTSRANSGTRRANSGTRRANSGTRRAKSGTRRANSGTRRMGGWVELLGCGVHPRDGWHRDDLYIPQYNPWYDGSLVLAAGGRVHGRGGGVGRGGVVHAAAGGGGE